MTSDWKSKVFKFFKKEFIGWQKLKIQGIYAI